MNKYLITGLCVCLAVVWLQRQSLRRAKAEMLRYKTNTEVLLSDVTKYKIKDSLNAARVGVLELKLNEYKKYYAEDQALVSELKERGRDLQQIATAATSTELHVSAAMQDSFLVAVIQQQTERQQTERQETIYTSAHCFNYMDEWVDLHGCVYSCSDTATNRTAANRTATDEAGGSWTFEGTIRMRDSLLVVETVKRKRFLGFLWKTKRIKNRQWDIVSKNPHTSIDDIRVVRLQE